MNIERLIRRAVHLRRRIDALKDGNHKQRLIEEYARIIWKIQDH
ncbi:MAG: hypothetical protein ACE5L6_02945 [Candidatus Bathyarchaeia archaeon]